MKASLFSFSTRIATLFAAPQRSGGARRAMTRADIAELFHAELYGQQKS